MAETTFFAGTFIFRPGDPGDRAYLIREGKVDLLRPGADRPTRVAQLGPGEVFGEMSLIEERPHSLTAWAVTAVKASVLTREEFENMLTTDPVTFRLYLKALFERLRSLSPYADMPVAESTQATTGTVSVTIHPLTHRAAETLPDFGLLIPKFPFRIGRAPEDREKEPLDLNDLWLLDREPFNISRNHAVIELHGNSVIIKDRGTKLGMYVNDVHLGGPASLRQATLEDGDNVVALGAHLAVSIPHPCCS